VASGFNTNSDMSDEERLRVITSFFLVEDDERNSFLFEVICLHADILLI
jgi:hypothetical protein